MSDRGKDGAGGGVIRQHLRRHRMQRHVPAERGDQHVGRAQQLGQSFVRLVLDHACGCEPAAHAVGGHVLGARSLGAHDELRVGPGPDLRAQLEEELGVVLQPQRARVEEEEAPVEAEPAAQRVHLRPNGQIRKWCPVRDAMHRCRRLHHSAHGLDELLADDDDRGASPQRAPLERVRDERRCARERAEPLAEQQRQPERVEILQPQHHRNAGAAGTPVPRAAEPPEDRSTTTRHPGGTRARSRQTAPRTATRRSRAVRVGTWGTRDRVRIAHEEADRVVGSGTPTDPSGSGCRRSTRAARRRRGRRAPGSVGSGTGGPRSRGRGSAH